MLKMHLHSFMINFFLGRYVLESFDENRWTIPLTPNYPGNMVASVVGVRTVVGVHVE